MNATRQWAHTEPDDRWVPTVIMVEAHRAAAWETIRRDPPAASSPRRIGERRRNPRIRLDVGHLIAALIGAALAIWIFG
jgi:hypothetical protein